MFPLIMSLLVTVFFCDAERDKQRELTEDDEVSYQEEVKVFKRRIFRRFWLDIFSRVKIMSFLPFPPLLGILIEGQ